MSTTTSSEHSSERAVVFGGGASLGQAWEIGVVAGLADAGLDVSTADLFVGTSAGATSAVWVAGGTPLAELFAGIVAPVPGGQGRGGARPRGAGHPQVRSSDLSEEMAEIMAASADPADMRRRLGAATLATPGASDVTAQAQRRAVVASRLPSLEWPARRVLIVTVDAETGEPVVLDRGSGVEVADAVTASTANGFTVPPHTVGGRRLIDGGYRSVENADLAAGYGRVLVLSPFGGRTRSRLEWGMHMAAQVDALRAGGSRVEAFGPDEASQAAFGEDMMNLAARPDAARAGFDQGRKLAGQLEELWR